MAPTKKCRVLKRHKAKGKHKLTIKVKGGKAAKEAKAAKHAKAVKARHKSKVLKPKSHKLHGVKVKQHHRSSPCGSPPDKPAAPPPFVAPQHAGRL